MHPLNIIQHDNRQKPRVKRSLKPVYSYPLEKYPSDIEDENFESRKPIDVSFDNNIIIKPHNVHFRTLINDDDDDVSDDFREIGLLGPINENYIADSPGLPIEDNDINIDLSEVSKFYDGKQIDYPPFFRAYDYESRYDKDDVVQFMIENEDSTELEFPRELEFQELKRFIGMIDYILHYLLNIDRYGYFKLLKERELFFEYPWRYLIYPIQYKDPNNLDEEDTDGDCDIDTEDAIDGQNMFQEEAIVN